MAAHLSGQPVDLRQAGSKNPGALNAAKSLGLSWGAFVLAADGLKGWLAGAAGKRLAGDNGAYLAGFAAVAGHCFPAWNGLKGGKGVATSAGACLACFPVYFPVDLAVSALALVASKRAEKATYVASALFVVAAVTWHLRRWPNAGGPSPTIGLPLFAAATTGLIYYRFLTSAATYEEALAGGP